MDRGTEEIFKERIAELDGMMCCDEEYVRQGERYHHCLKKMKELIDNDLDGSDILYGPEERAGLLMGMKEEG